MNFPLLIPRNQSDTSLLVNERFRVIDDGHTLIQEELMDPVDNTVSKWPVASRLMASAMAFETVGLKTVGII